jgi:hypothetical protein
MLGCDQKQVNVGTPDELSITSLRIPISNDQPHDADRMRRGHSRSCIAGVNQLTVEFASTLLGTVIAYWQGIRVALRKKTEVREKDSEAI